MKTPLVQTVRNLTAVQGSKFKVQRLAQMVYEVLERLEHLERLEPA
jgi:hypothetical protein